MRKILLSLIVVVAALIGCAREPETVIYPAATVLTMNDAFEQTDAVAVRDEIIVGVGMLDDLRDQHPNALIDRSFENHTLLPGFIDPHVHMTLGSMLYALPMAPPWDMMGVDCVIKGLPDRQQFLDHITKLVGEDKKKGPLIIYGYHDLIHGELTRRDLDAITTARPLIIWHYSAHDFYLNSAALKWAGIDASLHDLYEGIPLGEDGEPTGRIYEDALPVLYETIGRELLGPFALGRGQKAFSELLRKGGVTTVAEMGYGIFTFFVEATHLRLNWRSPDHSGYKLYLVPEHRAFAARYGSDSAQVVRALADGNKKAPAPVLPRVKFFADGAYYSQTMRISEPGYISGQSTGQQELWVTLPSALATVMQPYWEAGLGAHVHSNEDAAQRATLDALATLRESDEERPFVIEHGGMFSPNDVARANALGADLSAASHYVYYLGQSYQEPLGPERGAWLSPLGSFTNAGGKVALHSDAPLAPPHPLRAASVHMTRATREGGVLAPHERLTPRQALEAITINAAHVIGLEHEIGSIEIGKHADFTVLEKNPLNVEPRSWSDIPIWAVVLDGEKRPIR